MTRRILALSLALVLILGSFSGAVFAHAHEATFESKRTYINPLYRDSFFESDLVPFRHSRASEQDDYSDSIETIALRIRENMKKRQESIMLHVNVPDPSEETLTAFMDEAIAIAMAHTGVPVEGDYIRWQYGGWSYDAKGFYAEDGTVNWDVPLVVTYYTTLAQEQAVDKRVEELLDELDVYDATDYEIVLAIYDYICANVTYDHKNVNNDSYRLKNSAYAALIQNTAVCQGYALLFYRLALELGVDSRLIAGDGGGPHGWNIAKLGAYYYNLDSTWDAGKTEYQYFLRCPRNFKDHTRYAEYDTTQFHAEYPMDTADYVPPACLHKYSSTVTKPATCTESGLRTYQCNKCGDQYTEEIPALGHSWNDGVVTTDPTEDAPGVRTFTCTVCQDTYTEEIPPLEHIHRYTASVTSPTCTDGGYTTYTCTCGDSYIGDETPALGHSWNEGVVTTEPTEDTPGVRTFTCTVCQDTYTEEIPPLEHIHRYTASVTSPTCTDGGYTTYTCTCGDSYIGDETPALGHSWNEGVVTTEPTEDTPGVRTFTCTVCQDTYTEEIPCIEAEIVTTRIYGNDRCATAIEAAKIMKSTLGITKFDTILITSGNNFADALTGSHFAAVRHAPILLYREYAAAENERFILENLSNDGIVYVLGGTSAVPESVVESLVNAGIQVERLYGDTRFTTNLRILEKAGVSNEEILITAGFHFADSLSASATGLPILIVNNITGKLTEEQIHFLKAHSQNRYTIIGGTAAISTELELLIEDYVDSDVTRVYGNIRESTSTAVAERYYPEVDTVFIACSRDFPDGLCGGPLAYTMGAPLILINAGQEAAARQFIQDHEIHTGFILGGTSVVADESIEIAFGG